MKNTCLLFCAIALAAQGAAHTVTFRRLNGTVLSRVEVAHGGSVVAPAGPVEADFTFKGWDHGDWLGSVTNDIQVWALYEGTKTWPAGTDYGSESIAARDEPYSLEEYFQMYDNVAWTDEFSRSGTNDVNSSYWKYDTEDRNQLSYETSGANQKEIDGFLTITVRREKAYRNSWWGQSKEYDFTGGGIRGDNRVAFKYGRCEIRAKLTRQRGAWPAFWMMGNTGGWPSCGELDVLEQPSGGDWIAGTFHIPGRGNARSIQNGRTTTPEDGVHFGEGFHRYGTIVNAREIVWYVDDHIFKRMDVRDARYAMVHDRPYFIIFGMGLQSNTWVTAKGEAPVDKYDVPELDERGVDFLVDYCRIYTNTNADNTVAYDAPPPAAKLAAPVNATVWRGWDMTWGRPGSGAYQGNISKGYGERYYIKTALSQYFAREKTDILMFLTDPTVVTGENSGQFDIPGYTMVFMSANANDWNADDNAGSGNNGRLQLFASAMFNHDRFSVSQSGIDLLTLSGDANFTNCVAVCTDLKERASGARVKVVGVNITATNGVENAGGTVAQGFDALFAKLNAMKDENVIVFFQGMDWGKWNYIKNRASSELPSPYSLLGSRSSNNAYQSVFVTANNSAAAKQPDAIPVPKATPSVSYAHAPQALQATVLFDELPEADDGYADSFAAEDYARKITITFPDYSGEALADFPVLVRLSPAIDGFDYADFARADGDDLRFADAAGHLLPHEIDTWNTNGVSTVWVKVPSLTSATTITAHYGCARPARVDASQTWDGDYVGVWHLGERALPLRESSGTSADFTLSTGDGVAYAAPGVVGGAVDFTAAGRTNSVVAVDHAALEGFQTGTLEVWTKQAAHTQNAGILSKRAGYNSNVSYFVYDNGSATVLCLPKDGGGTNYQTCVSTSPAMNSWNHQAFTFDATAAADNTRGYLNGVGGTPATQAVAAFSGLANLCLGAMQAGAKDNFVGQVDEVRISKCVRSPDWIKATHDTVANASFAVYAMGDGGTAVDRTVVFYASANSVTNMDASLVTDAITNIVIRGGGVLTGAPIPSYTGAITVESGVYRITDASCLGAAGANPINVLDGATLFATNCPNDILSGKTVNLYGGPCAQPTPGVNCRNAKIVLHAAGSLTIGSDVDLNLKDADSLLYVNSTAWGLYKLTSGTIDLGGHKLTIESAWRRMEIASTVMNGGELELKNLELNAETIAAPTFLGTGTLRSNNAFNFKKLVSAPGWTITGSSFSLHGNINRGPETVNYPSWDGSVAVAGTMKIADYAGATGGFSNTVFTLKGPVSGHGTISSGPGWLNLFNMTNTFSGEVFVNGKSGAGAAQPILAGGGGIGVWNGAAVFPHATSVTFTNSARLAFMDDVPAALSKLTFDGADDQSITGGSAASRSTIAGLVKSGAGTLTVASPVRFTAPAEVSGGTLKLTASAAGPVIDELAFAAGATLDLSGDSRSVANLRGAPSVVNVGTFGVTNRWTLGAGDGVLSVAGALAFGAKATFTIAADDVIVPMAATNGITVATATDGITGAPKCMQRNWVLRAGADGHSLVLFYVGAVDGTVDEGAYGKKIVMEVAGYAGSTLTNFPVLVRLSTGIARFSYSDFRLPRGGDLRFTDADGRLIPHEIDTWDEGGTSCVWVKVPALAGGTRIVALYDCAPPDTPSAESVWDGDYVGVWHLGESALPLKESSGTSSDFTSQSGTGIGYAADGIVGGSVDFGAPRGGRVVNAPDHDALDGFTQCTFEAWTFVTNRPTDGDKNAGLLSKRSGYGNQASYHIYDTGSTTAIYVSSNSSTHAFGASVISPAVNAWTHQAYTFDAGFIRGYKDGVSSGANTCSAKKINAGAADLHLGNFQVGDSRNYPGKVDELRISRVVRSADWIKASHDTVSDAAFLTFALTDLRVGLHILFR
jgi:autotransporter-associated beta strand protein